MSPRRLAATPTPSSASLAARLASSSSLNRTLLPLTVITLIGGALHYSTYRRPSAPYSQLASSTISAAAYPPSQMSTSSSSPAAEPALLKTAEVLQPPSGQHKSTIIFAHGLGDSSAGFSSLFQQLQHSVFAHTRVVLPNAPTRPVSVNGGYRMRAWYDIYMLGADRLASVAKSIDSSPITMKEDTDGITESYQQLTQLIEHEAKLVGGHEKIVIGGFSQGAAMSLYTGLQYPHGKLGGIIACSGYLLLHHTFPAKLHEYGKQVPIMAYHGEADEVVPWVLGKMSYERLKSYGVNIDINSEARLGHSLSDTELQKLVQFAQKRLQA